MEQYNGSRVFLCIQAIDSLNIFWGQTKLPLATDARLLTEAAAFPRFGLFRVGTCMLHFYRNIQYPLEPMCDTQYNFTFAKHRVYTGITLLWWNPAMYTSDYIPIRFLTNSFTVFIGVNGYSDTYTKTNTCACNWSLHYSYLSLGARTLLLH